MNWTWIILVIFSCGAVQQANGHFGALEKLFGCMVEPPAPPNAVMQCSAMTKTCKAICRDNYVFMHGEKSIFFVCISGSWVAKGLPFVDEPPKCIAQSAIQCPARPKLPTNARRSCTVNHCVITCAEGYRFGDGSVSRELTCKGHDWVVDGAGLEHHMHCLPICDPPCENGGECIGKNLCKCSDDFRGMRCQYSTHSCSMEKKKLFNGAYRCKGDMESLSCELQCPKGIKFEFPPKDVYTCLYATGEFTPNKIPQCVYPPSAKVFGTKEISQHKVQHQLIRTSSKQTIIKYITSNEIISQLGIDTVRMVYYKTDTRRLAKPSICSIWKTEIQTFDGLIYPNQLACSHILLKKNEDVNMMVVLDSGNSENIGKKPLSINMFLNDNIYTLLNKNGTVLLKTPKYEQKLPIQVMGMSISYTASLFQIDLYNMGIKVKWNGHRSVHVEVSKDGWGEFVGLCGSNDGDPLNDMQSPDGRQHKTIQTFTDSWRPANQKICEAEPQKVIQDSYPKEVEKKAKRVCQELFDNPDMKNCTLALDNTTIYNTCITDYIQCESKDPISCACDSYTSFAYSCQFNGIKLGKLWRDQTMCPMQCPSDKIYNSCGPSKSLYCGGAEVEKTEMECFEGCYCPEGYLEHEGRCVMAKHCPCKWHGKFYNPGDQVEESCSKCKCVDSEWKCEKTKCAARCTHWGHSHYRTFDGKKYSFNGQCSYYLLKTPDISIEVDNTECYKRNAINEIALPGKINKNCIKDILVRYKGMILKIDQGRLFVNDTEITIFPRKVFDGVALIRQPSSTLVSIQFSDKMNIWYNTMEGSITINLPESYKDMTNGLCGTFNNNMNDDFRTPQKDVEVLVEEFAKKWETRNDCSDFKSGVKNICKTNPQFRANGEKLCGVLHSKTFDKCHSTVDPHPYYESCLEDYCTDDDNKNRFYVCSSLALYARACAQNGIVLNWRFEVKDCIVQCPLGQVYDQCGDSCARSCGDLQYNKTDCKSSCIDGCRCASGLVLDQSNECIPASLCPCIHQAEVYKPDYIGIQTDHDIQNTCKCERGAWVCSETTSDDLKRYKSISKIKSSCNASENMEYTSCELNEPKTCKNMHIYFPQSSIDCIPGCVCKEGYVLDKMNGKCILPTQCPCHHAGKSYEDGQKIKMDCNRCKCTGGEWECTNKECAPTCSFWGESHVTTFDGMFYDFRGPCEYIFSRGKLPSGEGYEIITQDVLCSSTGETCSKSATIRIFGDAPESITLDANVPIPGVKNRFTRNVEGNEKWYRSSNYLKKMLVYRVGIYIVVNIPSMGVHVKWDRGTRFYLTLDKKWKNQVGGLCGNYNNDIMDETMSPSKGLEKNVLLFVDSWKLDEKCPEPSTQTNACVERPNRKNWAEQKCEILRSSVFAACHDKVPVDGFYERCVHDACACDEGGDCECVCTCLSNYAFECSRHDVHLKWRSSERCPLQCDAKMSHYSPCVSACPIKTCGNAEKFGPVAPICAEEHCVEGCEINECENGMIYKNDSFTDCVPRNTCQEACIELDGITYYEGDLVKSDACHSCRCTKGKLVCQGVPCASSEPTIVINKNEIVKCPPGEKWSECAVPCSHACDYYSKELIDKKICEPQSQCKPGCVPATVANLQCDNGKLWRDRLTCVKLSDCTCMSHSGKVVRPDEKVQESECKTCQCVNNNYICDTSVCNAKREVEKIVTPVVTAVASEKVLIVKDAATPPPSCPKDLLVPLIQGEKPLPHSAMNCSSYLSDDKSPNAARIHSANEKDFGCWSPKTPDLMEYLEVIFETATPIYQIIVKGNPKANQYVTSFKMLYSLDNKKFHYIMDAEQNIKIFRGPLNNIRPAVENFDFPIEAKYVRIYPLTWQDFIAMKVELMGCGKPKEKENILELLEPEATIDTVDHAEPKPQCADKMGIATKQMNPSQISVSSVSPELVNIPLIDLLCLDGTKGWMPYTSSAMEYIIIDFTDQRIITGLITSGGPYGWVESYKVAFSSDKFTWNEIKSAGSIEFAANFDSNTTRKVFFATSVRGRYMKIIPLKWSNAINMRIEPLGCFEPYPVIKEVPKVIPKYDCKVCDDIKENFTNKECPCKENLFWSGISCVPKKDCPCIHDGQSYAVGIRYTTDDCKECICTLGGILKCEPKVCGRCPDGLVPKKTTTCECHCEPCPKDFMLCPTSQSCIPLKARCDGVMDCPDDEVNCTKTIEKENVFYVHPQHKTVTKTTQIIHVKRECPKVECPPGYEISFVTDEKARKHKSKSLLGNVGGNVEMFSRSNMGEIGDHIENLNELPTSDDIDTAVQEQCPEYSCIMKHKTIEYSTAAKALTKCPEGYDLVKVPGKEKETFSCQPKPEKDAICEITSGTMVTTFDGTIFSYPICRSVVIARNFVNRGWNVVLSKNCQTCRYKKSCGLELVIADTVAKANIKVMCDNMIEIGDYKYTPDQLTKSKAFHNLFSVSLLGNELLLTYPSQGFWVMKSNNTVKVGVTADSKGMVDGLCGFYSQHPQDDKRLPTGIMSTSTEEFGDSWAVGNDNRTCAESKCSEEMLEKASDMCSKIKHKIFERCHTSEKAVDLFIAKCIESTCDCMTENPDKDMHKCQCNLFKDFVKDCLTKNEFIEVLDWHSVLKCEEKCPSPMVYSDCFRRKCQPTCDNLNDCPKVDGFCFSGCYCPNDLVKSGNDCVPPSKCLNCICESYGKPNFLTFDRNNFTISNVNCTYLLTKDTLEKPPLFEISLKMDYCDPTIKNTITPDLCPSKIYISSKNDHLVLDIYRKDKPLANGKEINDLTTKWFKAKKNGNELMVKLPDQNLEIFVQMDHYLISIKLPGAIHSKNLEGLCGNCDGDPKNDLVKNPNAIKNHSLPMTVVNSWLVHKPEQGIDISKCSYKRPEVGPACPYVPKSKDPCYVIKDPKIFGKCNMLVDPAPFFSACKEYTCANKGVPCDKIAVYANECMKNGICIDWRGPDLCPYKCPSDMKYKPCSCNHNCGEINEARQEEKKLSCSSKHEGCFCPDGFAYENKTCIPEKNCVKACDDDGHMPGQQWKPDLCTNCECKNNGKVWCSTISCPTDPPCPKGTIETKDIGECCPKKTCVPKPLSQIKCPELKHLECSDDQKVEKIFLENGCASNVCNCISEKECKEKVNLVELKPGQVLVQSKSGCCTNKIVCKKEACPPKPYNKCKKDEEMVEIQPKQHELDNLECCPHYECKPLTCPVKTDEGIKYLNVGESIKPHKSDCNMTVCIDGKEGVPETLSLKPLCCDKECPLGFKKNDKSNSCCSECIPEKCVHNGRLYGDGDKWMDPSSNCTELTCIKLPTGEFKTTISCNKCLSSQGGKSTGSCDQVLIPIDKTVKYIKIYDQNTKSKCWNESKIPFLYTCAGYCESSAEFVYLSNTTTVSQSIGKSSCCKMDKTHSIPVTLTCENGNTLRVQVETAMSCKCQQCAV